MSKEELRSRTIHNLSLHPPGDAGVGHRMDVVQANARSFANVVIDVCPESRELSLALTALEEATQWAIGAIARNQQ